jgi:hypothetical protein
VNFILTLLAVSALLGLASGLYFSWIAILVSGPILAIFSATVSQSEGFDALTGIAIIVVCLTVNQGAYLIGATWLLDVCRTDEPSLPQDHPNDEPVEVRSTPNSNCTRIPASGSLEHPPTGGGLDSSTYSQSRSRGRAGHRRSKRIIADDFRPNATLGPCPGD